VEAFIKNYYDANKPKKMHHIRQGFLPDEGENLRVAAPGSPLLVAAQHLHLEQQQHAPADEGAAGPHPECTPRVGAVRGTDHRPDAEDDPPISRHRSQCIPNKNVIQQLQERVQLLQKKIAAAREAQRAAAAEAFAAEQEAEAAARQAAAQRTAAKAAQQAVALSPRDPRQPSGIRFS
jgi:hypothetical protein